MTRRLFCVALALSVGVLAVVVLDLALGAPGAYADDQVERKNCPVGFHWVRMSGQCCVQDGETIPAHGKIGYTGNSLCVEGYVGVYDRRPTTDGEGPPGCPDDRAYSFLTACVTREEYERLEAAGELPGQGTGGGRHGDGRGRRGRIRGRRRRDRGRRPERG